MRPETLGALLLHTVETHAARPAATDATGTLDWAGFAARADGYAGLLQRQGIARGDRVALWLPNSTDYLALIFACARLGAVSVHVNTRFRAEEVGYLLRRSRARAIVTAWDFPAVDFAAILAAVSPEDRAGLQVVIGRGQPAQDVGVRVAPLVPDGAAQDASTPEQPCLTYTTSGTTSGPKLVLHDQQAIAGHAHDVMRAIGTDTPDAALLGVTPFCGTFGNAAAMAAVAAGAHIVCVERFDAAEADALIRQHRITHAVGGDDLLARLTAAANGRRHTTMRFFGYAAFHPDAARSVQAADAIGLMPRGVYGSSEVQALFTIQPDERRLLPGGDPVSDEARIDIRDPESGESVAPGEAGELCLGGPSLFLGYLDNEAATSRARTTDGLFRTSDLAHAEGRGFIYRMRLGDTLRLGGFLVNPEEIEGFLQTQPGIDGAQVVAAASACVAFVRLAAGATLDEPALIASCRARLAHYKTPARIVAVPAFPMTDSANGMKIQRAKLRDMAEGLMIGEGPTARESPAAH